MLFTPSICVQSTVCARVQHIRRPSHTCSCVYGAIFFGNHAYAIGIDHIHKAPHAACMFFNQWLCVVYLVRSNQNDYTRKRIFLQSRAVDRPTARMEWLNCDRGKWMECILRLVDGSTWRTFLWRHKYIIFLPPLTHACWHVQCVHAWISSFCACRPIIRLGGIYSSHRVICLLVSRKNSQALVHLVYGIFFCSLSILLCSVSHPLHTFSFASRLYIHSVGLSSSSSTDD